MSLKDLKLSEDTLLRLYRQPLHQDPAYASKSKASSVQTVEEPEVTPEKVDKAAPVAERTSVEAAPAIKYMGENAAGITILVNEQNALYLNDELFEFLAGILKACNFTIKDVAIINLHKTPADYEKLIAATTPKVIILFGVEATEISLPMMFPQYQVYKHNSISYLSAPELASIINDKPQKAALWKALKAVFGI